MVEAQAIARVNRLGQKRNVRVVKYIMKGTVEEVRFSLMIGLRRRLSIIAGIANTANTQVGVRQSWVERGQ
jgi:hypothetical protein